MVEERTMQPRKKIRPSELPIYGDPEPVQLVVVDEKITKFREYVSQARQWTWNYMDSIKETTDRIRDKYEIGKSHTKDTLAYIQEDSAVLPRAAIITVFGLGGIVAGYKGGIARKAFYSSLAMTAGASICYPNQALDIGKQGWSIVSDLTLKTYHDTFPGSSNAPKAEGPKKLEKVQTAALTDALPATAKVDYGMSKPDEKDMYTTRGS